VLGVATALLVAAWVIHLGALIVLALFGAHRLWLVAVAIRHRRGDPVPPSPVLPLPFVTVQLPLYNEPTVAARLIDAVAALDWPRDRLEIQILDDSSDQTSAICAERARRLADEGRSVLHLQRAQRCGYKAGALEAGRARARGELFLVLDADFVPAPDLLRSTAGHFADPGVGMVQVRWEHLNRDAGVLTEIEALLLDGHFAIEQAARARSGRVFNFNGTAGLWRAQAIADAGGWQADTLTEDLDLSYRAALAGWRFVYLERSAVPAELPAGMAAFRSQQFRWAKGSIECARKLIPVVARSRLPLPLRIEAYFHLVHNVPYLLTAIMVLAGAVALGGGDGPSWRPAVHAIAAGVTALVLGTYCVLAQHVLGRRNLWSTVARVPALVALTIGISFGQTRAVIEGALGRRSEFVRTPKDGGQGRRSTWNVGRRHAAPHRKAGWLELVTAAAIASSAAAAAMRGGAIDVAFLSLSATGLGWVGWATATGR